VRLDERVRVRYPAIMSAGESFSRSPALMSVGDTALVVIDVQERLAPAIAGIRRIIWNIRRLVEGAKLLGLPVVATEQYPQGLGRSVPELAAHLGEVPAKLSFSAMGCPGVFQGLKERDISKLLLTGIEAHVCVQQTAMDLLAAGWRVYLAVDAVGSRAELDAQTAIRRMDSSGVTLTTTEAALFEWCFEAGTPQFKQISRLVREEPPAE
jgi:nicotinamidase-related amidase